MILQKAEMKALNRLAQRVPLQKGKYQITIDGLYMTILEYNAQGDFVGNHTEMINPADAE